MKIVSWVIGIFFTITAIATLSIGDNVLSGILVLLAALIILPVTRNAFQTALQKKDDTIEITTKTAFISGVILFISGAFFVTTAKQITLINNNVISVSDFDYTLNEEQAVSVAFGESQSNFCDVTIHRRSINSGYNIRSSQRSMKSLSGSCNWGGKYYVQSSKHPTYLSFSIVSLDTENNSAQLSISLHLLDISTANTSNNDYITLENITLNLNEKQFNNLVKKI